MPSVGDAVLSTLTYEILLTARESDRGIHDEKKRVAEVMGNAHARRVSETETK
jgi:hypothetical protein